MIELAEITSKIRSKIAEDSFFDGILVVENLGLSSAAIESSLLSCGVAVVVNPILGGTGPSQAGACTSTVKVSVSVRINPTVNAADGGAGVNVYEAIKHVAAAVLGYAPNPGEKTFELDPEDQFGLEDFNDALLAYSISFLKKTKLV